jgi:cysteine desulfurase/selenocysteine lyase
MTAARRIAHAAPALFDVDSVRREFPCLAQAVHGKPLAYLDNAASSQTPLVVVDALRDSYLHDRANIHRGVHLLSQRATEKFEATREKVRAFLHAPEARECIFVRGTTEALNLVAQTHGRANVRAGDEILVTGLEHHSNIVPWQMLAAEKGAKLVVAPIDERGVVSLETFTSKLSNKTRIAAFTHVSNALGTVNPVRAMADAAHAVGAVVVVDGAQAVPHMAIDVTALGADFYAFSAHKLFGPTGVGVLWGKAALLEAMPPWQGGGDMILEVTFEKTTFNVIPNKFEAGTPDITGVIAFGTALDWLRTIDTDAAFAYEDALVDEATARLCAIHGVRLVGTAPDKRSVVSFVVDNVHPHDLGTILDLEGVAVRAGHHCAQPLMDALGVSATVRASFAFMNVRSEIDALVRGVEKAIEVLG